MKVFTVSLYVIAILLGSFGYWGTSTRSGRSHFDEMAGIIPELAALMSVVLFFTAIIFSLIIFIRKRRFLN